MTILEAAMSYIAEGYKVFPCKLDKTPYTPHGFLNATQTQQGVREYWGKWPEAGIGLVTDGLVVVDFDKKKGGEESKAAMEAEYGKLPPTRTHRTGGGGLHYIYRNPNGTNIRNATALGGYTGVDLRANGGYIVAPPSPHESGKTYKILDNSPISNAPDWLMVMAKQRSFSRSVGDEGTGVKGGSFEESIPEGQRNATLTSLAGTMRRRGMPQSAIEAALLEVNRQQCNPPLPDKEIENIAKSVSRYQPNTDPVNFPDPLRNIPQETDITDETDETDTPLVSTDKTDSTDKSLTNVSSQRRDHLVWKMVDRWLLDHKGEKFDLDMISRHLSITDRDSRHSVSKKLSYEVDKEKLEKSDRLYRYINKDIVNIDWMAVSKSLVLSIKWPYGYEDQSRFGFDGFLQIPAKGIIAIAGVSNTGKTGWVMNLLAMNMDNIPCTLMGNEYDGSTFRDRFDEMEWANPLNEDGTPKFELIERYKDWKDIIRPDNMNIIDWVSLDGVAQPFYYIGEIIQGIRSKLGNGCAVICIQKESGKEYGMGGGFGQHLASLYLNIDFNPDKSLRMTVKKAKQWSTHNPNGEMYTFNLSRKGTLFSEIHAVKKCHACFGRGEAKGGGVCIECGGSGYVDA